MAPEVNLVSVPEHEVLKVSYCDRSMSVICQQIALNHYFSYTSGLIDSNLGRKYQGDL